MRKMRSLVLTTAIAATALPACTTTFEEAPRRQIVMVDERGQLLDPIQSTTIVPGTGQRFQTVDARAEKDAAAQTEQTAPQPPADGDAALPAAAPGDAAPAAGTTSSVRRSADERYFDAVIASIKKGAPIVNGRRQVLIFIHGGLNPPADSIERARRVAKVMDHERETSDPTTPWPVFINWRSGGPAAWWEHACCVRQGDRTDLLSAYGILTPFYVVADVVRGVGRSPLVLGNQISSFAAELSPSLRQRVAVKRAEQLDRTADVRIGTDTSSAVARGAEGTITTLLSLPAAILLDGAGNGTWDNLHRRTMMLFHRERDFERPGLSGSSGDGHGSGALARFLSELENATATGPGANREEWEITLIGHSMGSFVVNEILWEFPELPVRTIVYMAAACPLRDYHESVVPWMREHPETRMFHLTLNDTAEQAEQFQAGFLPVPLVPRGSLLVWIDNFLGKPATLLDRTAGRFENLMAAEHLTEEWPPSKDGTSIRSRIVITQFDYGGDAADRGPVKHGGFDEFPFWRETFWRGDASVRRHPDLVR